jgi:hypothetical protein
MRRYWKFGCGASQYDIQRPPPGPVLGPGLELLSRWVSMEAETGPKFFKIQSDIQCPTLGPGPRRWLTRRLAQSLGLAAYPLEPASQAAQRVRRRGPGPRFWLQGKSARRGPGPWSNRTLRSKDRGQSPIFSASKVQRTRFSHVCGDRQRWAGSGEMN